MPEIMEGDHGYTSLSCERFQVSRYDMLKVELEDFLIWSFEHRGFQNIEHEAIHRHASHPFPFGVIIKSVRLVAVVPLNDDLSPFIIHAVPEKAFDFSSPESCMNSKGDEIVKVGIAAFRESEESISFIKGPETMLALLAFDALDPTHGVSLAVIPADAVVEDLVTESEDVIDRLGTDLA